jgi:hypothetical protein
MKLTRKQRDKAEALFGNGLIRECILNAVSRLVGDYEDQRKITDWFVEAIVYYRKM